jgi:hypothetical protein
MSKVIRTPHHVLLVSGQLFTVEAHMIDKDRYFDGVDYLYFETFCNAEPKVEGVTHYHTWQMKKGNPLTAWLVPTFEVDSIKEKLS